MKRKIELKQITLVAILSALCCAGTYVKIPMPAGDFIHLGNFVMIISALLLGGLSGGIVGSLGMGLFDLINYSHKPSTILRTFILKFCVGFLVGYLFSLILRRKTKTKPLHIGMIAFCSVVLVGSLILFSLGDFKDFGATNNFSSVYYNIMGSSKSFKISLFIPALALVFLLFNILAIVFEGKLSPRSRAALFAVTIAVLFNIVGEFFFRWLLEGIMLDGFEKSLITATSKIPGSLITGFISVTLVVLTYEPVYKALSSLSLIKNMDFVDVEKEEIE